MVARLLRLPLAHAGSSHTKASGGGGATHHGLRGGRICSTMSLGVTLASLLSAASVSAVVTSGLHAKLGGTKNSTGLPPRPRLQVADRVLWLLGLSTAFSAANEVVVSLLGSLPPLVY